MWHNACIDTHCMYYRCTQKRHTLKKGLPFFLHSTNVTGGWKSNSPSVWLLNIKRLSNSTVCLVSQVLTAFRSGQPAQYCQCGLMRAEHELHVSVRGSCIMQITWAWREFFYEMDSDIDNVFAYPYSSYLWGFKFTPEMYEVSMKSDLNWKWLVDFIPN